MEECHYKQMEWKADQWVEIHNNHNISYPKRDYLTRPQSWDTVDEPEDGLPHIMEQLQPLHLALKQCHYRNSYTTPYHTL
jgi:hypothetical protein